MNIVMNTLHDILENLHNNKVKYTLYYNPDGFESVEKVVKHLSVDEDMVLKTMIVKSVKGFYTFLIRGGKKLDINIVRLEIQDEEARLAKKTELIEGLGMPPGAISPLHPIMTEKTTIYLDLDSTGYDEVIVGGGTLYHVIKISMDELVRILKPYYSTL